MCNFFRLRSMVRAVGAALVLFIMVGLVSPLVVSASPDMNDQRQQAIEDGDIDNSEPPIEYDSWVRGTPTHSNDGWRLVREEDEVTPIETDEEREQVSKSVLTTQPSATEKAFAEILANIANFIRKSLRTTGDENGNTIDATASGIIMGKLMYGTTFFVFDLTDNNIYGKIGASVYVLLRLIVFSALFLVTIWNVTKTLFMKTGSGLANVKDALLTTVMVMLLLFVMPQIVDFVCEVRDGLQVHMFRGMARLTVGSEDNSVNRLNALINIEEEYYAKYAGGLLNPPEIPLAQSPGSTAAMAEGGATEEALMGTAVVENRGGGNPTVANALVFLLVCLVPFVFIINYVKIAIQQLILFGLFPVFALAAPSNKKTIGEWSAVVFTNAFIPVIDLTIMMVPMLLIEAIEEYLGGHTTGEGLLKVIIVTTCMFSIIPIRNQLIQMFGNKFGFKGGLGLFGAMGMAGGAILGAARMASSLRSTAQSSSSKNDAAGMADKKSEHLGKVSEQKRADLESVPAAPTSNDSVLNMGAGGSANASAEANTPDVDVAKVSGTAATDERNAETNEQGINHMLEGDFEISPDTTAETLDGVSPMSSAGIDGGEAGATGGSTAEQASGAGSAAGDSGAGGAGGPSVDAEYAHMGASPEAEDIPADATMVGAAAVASEVVTADMLSSNSRYEGLTSAIDSRARDMGALGGKFDENNKSFNMTRAANLQSIDNMRLRTTDIDGKISGENASIVQSRQAIAGFDSEIKRRQALVASNKNNMPTDTQLRDKAIKENKAHEAEIANLNLQMARETERIRAAEVNIQTYNTQKSALNSEISRRVGIEREMAQAYRDAGMDGRTFNSAKEFELNLNRENNIRSIESFREIRKQMGTLDGVLSPHEREVYAHKVELRERYKNVVSGALAVGAAAGATAVGGVAALGMGLSGESGYLGYRMATGARDGLMDPNAIRLAGSDVVDAAGLVKHGAVKGKEAYKRASEKRG